VRLTFSGWTFDSGQRTLERGVERITLSPKAFQLLDLLLLRRPEVVSKEELLKELWPDTFVSDANVHNLVSEVRTALGEDPRTTRFIRTVPRCGYAFQAEAREEPPIRVSGRTQPPTLVYGDRDFILAMKTNLLGRERDCVARIEHATISRHHASIVITGTTALLQDLGSRNGTWVNGRRIGEPTELEDGDEVRLGSVTLTYRSQGAPSSASTKTLVP
jgi:DNA-binding winged helix-turn-helix (wHTH) protein